MRHSGGRHLVLDFNPFATSSLKFRQSPRKLQILTSFTINFSSNSDTYSMIYGQLRIKFHYRDFLNFKELCNYYSTRFCWFGSSFESWQQEFQRYYFKNKLQSSNSTQNLHKSVNDASYVQKQIWRFLSESWKCLRGGFAPSRTFAQFTHLHLQICICTRQALFKFLCNFWVELQLWS